MNSKGFTVVELLITLIIVAIIFGYGVPNLRAVTKNNRITTQTNELIADLNLARSEAIKRETRVVICQSSDSITCGGGQWEDGRIIFVDANGDSVFTSGTPGEELLRVRNRTGIEALTIRNSDAEMTTSVTYTQRGMTTLSQVTAGTPHHFRVCDERGAAFARGVLLDATGRGSVIRNSMANITGITISGPECP